jgi:cytochrome c
MKNTLIILGFVLFLISCGDNSSTTSTDKKTTEDTTAAAKPAEPATDPEAEKGLALIGKSDCLTCHKLNEASTGPAYAAVAAKYQGQQPGIIDTLADKIIKGGSGNWGEVPMVAHPQVSKEDARAMVHYVLSVK